MLDGGSHLGASLPLPKGLRVPFHPNPGPSVPAQPGCCRLHIVTGSLPHVTAPSPPAQPPQAAVPCPASLLLVPPQPEKIHITSRHSLEGRVAVVPPQCPPRVSSARRAATSDSESGLSKWLLPFRNKPISPQRLILAPNSPQQPLPSVQVSLPSTHETAQALTSFPGKTGQTEEQPIAWFYLHLGLCGKCCSPGGSSHQQPPCFPFHPKPCPHGSAACTHAAQHWAATTELV